ncbi:zinc finger protein 64 isoform 2-T2 [Spheniscus humboldti]
MNPGGGGGAAAPAFPGPVQFPGGTTVLVELTPDIHICGICKQQFNNLDAFVGHKQSGCQLTSATAGATSTVQFVSEETVPSTQAQTKARTIASETQTITVSAPEFVFEHGYQTYLPSESSEPPTAAIVSTPPKARSRKSTSSLTQKKLNCCYPGCQFKTSYGMKDMERHLRTHTGDAPFQCQMCPAKFKINSDLKRHMRVHSGEKPYKCEFCEVRCAMKGNLKSHIRIKHSMENTLKCPECEFQCGNKTSLRHHIRTHQPEQPVKCSECSYSCSNKAALKVHERIHCKDRPFKCEFCSFDTKQRSNLTTHVRKAHGDKVKTKKQTVEKEGDRPKQGGSRQVARLDAKKAFKCDLCDASFVREDSLRSHKKQHSMYNGSKNNELAVLQLQMDPSRQASAPITVSHLQVPLQAAQVSPYNEGRVKIIVGHQVPQTNSIVQASSVNVVPPTLVSQNQEDLSANSRLQLLGQVSLLAPPPPPISQSEAGPVAQPAVLLTTHDQSDGSALHQTLIPAAPVSSHEASANQAFITSSGISCSDLEGLNALIQEGATEVTVVSDGGQSITVSTSAPPPPIFSSSSHTEAPKQTYSIIQSGAHTALLCPADSIPD